MKTDKRDRALIEDIAGWFDLLASDSDAFARRGYSRKENTRRAAQWREAAAAIRSIELVEPKVNS